MNTAHLAIFLGIGAVKKRALSASLEDNRHKLR
jgi:hypothetical protein